MTSVNGYRDRSSAGQLLARLVAEATRPPDPLVLALPRGGVPVGRAVARVLAAPLDVFVVRKLGIPGAPETAMGAVASGGAQLLDEALIAKLGLAPAVVSQTILIETAELARREVVYRGDRSPPEFAGRAIILVDDGVATGYTMRVAVLALRQLGAAHLTIAVPVGAPETCALLSSAVDQLICPLQPSPFQAVGLWYDHFPALSDADVQAGLQPG